jgi:histidine ammonia-lyase
VKGNGVTGAVLPGADFEPLPSVLSFEETGLVLAHNSLASPNVSSS